MEHDQHAERAQRPTQGRARPTRAQLVSVGVLSVLALVAGVLVPANLVNLGLSAEDVGESIMPPGMIMPNDAPGDAMKHMTAVDPRKVSYIAAPDDRGDRPLVPRMDGEVKVFDLDVSVIRWYILRDEPVLAYAFNRQVPGPQIRIRQGDRIRLIVTNHLPEATSVHWHGMILPNEMDGPAGITQKPIEPGESYRYEFTATQQGTYFYHSHRQPDRQQALGMYGRASSTRPTLPSTRAIDTSTTSPCSCRSGSSARATPTRRC
jgi:FtsP/CotA-like multicopper oxidase with cupredoxin domain